MAPRAAARLESLGFEKVFEYKAGKLDWLAAGLPTEGTNSECPRAGDASRKDVLVSGLTDRLGEVAERARKTRRDVVVVVDAERVVLGLLRSKELALDPELVVEEAMRPGPSTFRPYVSINEMADYMVEHRLDSSPITTSDGKLVGVLFTSDALRLAGSPTACVRKLITP
ncbi:MAG: CBS domain-containing protein [Candidatus Dormibacteraeota bacterium]|nr:CBS domain-containing protein [Candidatus Dormibacteraeota bacterium]